MKLVEIAKNKTSSFLLILKFSSSSKNKKNRGVYEDDDEINIGECGNDVRFGDAKKGFVLCSMEPSGDRQEQDIVLLVNTQVFEFKDEQAWEGSRGKENHEFKSNCYTNNGYGDKRIEEFTKMMMRSRLFKIKADCKWKNHPQPPGYFKLNTDAAVDEQRNRMGYGWVLRNDTGQFVAAACILGRGLFTPKEAEAMAIREAFSWTKTHGVSRIQVKLNALQIVQSLKHSDDDSSFDLVILDIKDMLRSLNHVDISHVSRTANSVTHSLAREVCSMSVSQEWNSTPPFIVNALYFDLN
nr:uncharacterized protein LOC109154289 [Ipomoea batatas]